MRAGDNYIPKEGSSSSVVSSSSSVEQSSSSAEPSSSSEAESSSSVVPSSSSVAPLSGSSGTFVDTRNDKTYKWVKISTQTWMAVSTVPATAATGGVPARTISAPPTAGTCSAVTAMWAGPATLSLTCTMFVASRTRNHCLNHDSLD